MKTLLVDGDVVLYEVTTSVEEAICWGDDFWTLHADMRVARGKLNANLMQLKKTLKADNLIIALSDVGNNFRKNLSPDYKKHRKRKRKPVIYYELREFCEDVYECVCWDNLEADDVLGLLSDSYVNSTIVTIDKDLRTIKGSHYNPMKPDEGETWVDGKEADFNFYKQAMMGDLTDGYKGCPGVGPKTAERLLKEHGSSWETVRDAYLNAGETEDYALLQARMARILRPGEYNERTGEPILWQP